MSCSAAHHMSFSTACFPREGLPVLAIKCMGFVAVVCHSEVILVHLSGRHSIASEPLLKLNPTAPAPLAFSAPLLGWCPRGLCTLQQPAPTDFSSLQLCPAHVSLLIATASASLLCPAYKCSGCCWKHFWDVTLLGLCTGGLLLGRHP